MNETNKLSGFPKLTPIIADWINEFTSQKARLKALFEQYGSPINVHHINVFQGNITLFKEVLERYDLSHKIFFARKANKSSALLYAAHAANEGIDTASYNELKECLSAGVPAEDLVVTAAIKTKDLVTLAVKNQVLIIVDNKDELDLIIQTSAQLNQKAQIGLRVGGFTYENRKLYTRFGFDIDQVKGFLTDYVKPVINLKFEGLHFHLDGYSIPQRIQALTQLIHLADELTALDLPVSFIDIGGGFLVNYLKHKEEWIHFNEMLKKAIAGTAKEITFKNNGLGYQNIKGMVCGHLNTYPYYNEISKANFLEKIISADFEHESLALALQKRNITLRIEPGRALMDQVGITLARVVFRKQDCKGNLLVGLDMNKTQLFSSSADFLLDPIFIPLTYKNENIRIPCYFTGAYCLESDVILKRCIELTQYPEIGDIICFPNTAGYMMHFYESSAHKFDLATNLNLNEAILRDPEKPLSVDSC